jgi:hypothetical protein
MQKLRPNQDKYQEWAERALEQVRTKHGCYANYLLKKEIPLNEITVPEAPHKKNEPAQFAIWEEEMKTIIAHKKKIQDVSPNVIGLIQSLLSEESKSKLRDSTEYEGIIENNDAVKFWTLVEKTHLGVDTVDEEIRRIIEEIKFQLLQDQNQSLDQYCETSSNKIYKLKSIGCALDEKKLSVQFLLGLNKAVFSRQVGLWLSEKGSITDSYQKTKEMVQNWYKGQVSAHAIMTTNTKSSKDSNNSSSRDGGYTEQINSSVEDKRVKCIFCNKNGHSAQVCTRLIDWLSKQKKSRKKEQQKSNNEYANLVYHNDFDDDIGF